MSSRSASITHYNLRNLEGFRPMRMTKDAARGLGGTHEAESEAHARNKALHITYTVQSSSASNNNQCSNVEKKEKTRGEKMKAISRMKELLKRAAAAKAEKGGKFIGRKVLQFRNRVALKAVPDDDQLSNDSPKISLRWEVESCSTTASVYSTISSVASIVNADSTNCTPLHVRDQFCARTGNWITTDSECKAPLDNAQVGSRPHGRTDAHSANM